MQSRFANELNKEQLDAVTHVRGPSIIMAGAGSGKTRVLTYKAMYMLDSRTSKPQELLMLTFTNKAAAEMKERIMQKIDPALNPQFITARTFHSFCVLLLRKYGPLGKRDRSFAILDTGDQDSLAKEIIKERPSSLRVSPASLLNFVSSAKNMLETPQMQKDAASDFFQEHLAALYSAYEKKLEELNAFDFDDLLVQTARTFQEKPTILSSVQQNYPFVLIDEYQDTNHAQYRIASDIGKNTRNITVVGDFSQSIYSWRGADFTNLEKFKDDFPEATTFSLEQNYRSTQPILTAAFNVISNNTGHPILKLWTEKEKGEEVQVVGLENDEEESVFVISTVRKLIEEEGYRPSEIAILYRVNAQSRIFEEMLIRAGISYKIYGGVRFYERKEIKDVLACLRLVLNPQDRLSLDRINKLGKKRSRDIQTKLQTVDATLTPEKLLQAILDKTPYLELLDPDNEADASRLENIKELVSVAHSFETVQDFLDTIALVETGYEQEDAKVEERVNLMSIHAAKGLEFRAVFVVGLEDGNLPHTRSLANDKSLQEERRLLYVAITRAQEQLYLTYVKRRMVYGRTQYYLPSQFLTEAGLVQDTSITF